MSTATQINIEAATRQGAGKGVARSLRRDGKVPAVIYGGSAEPVSIEMSEKDITIAYNKGRFYNRLLSITLDGKEVQTLPREVQTHPVTDRIEHVDFLRVEKGQEVRVDIPVKVLGKEKSIGLRRGGALNIVRHEISFFCKPENIPANIEVDITEFDVGTSIHINDVQLPEGVRPELERNFTIATIAGRSAKDEAATTAATPAEGAAAPAAGEAAAPAADKK